MSKRKRDDVAKVAANTPVPTVATKKPRSADKVTAAAAVTTKTKATATKAAPRPPHTALIAAAATAKTSGACGASAPRLGACGAPAPSELDKRILRANTAAYRAMRSLKLADILVEVDCTASKMSARVTAFCALLREECDDECFQLNLAMMHAGRPLMTYFIDFFTSALPRSLTDEPRDVQKIRIRTCEQLHSFFNTESLSRFLSAFQLTNWTDATQQSILQYICGIIVPAEESSFITATIRHFVTHRIADVHHRDTAGRTCLHTITRVAVYTQKMDAWVFGLFHELQADFDAADANGDTFLHLLVQDHTLYTFEKLCEIPSLARVLPWSIPDRNGRTPLALADIRATAVDVHHGDRVKIARLLKTLDDTRKNEVRPLLRELLLPHLISDLANIVLAYE